MNKNEVLTDAEINVLRQAHGITSSGRGIKEFTQVRDFAKAVIEAYRAKLTAGVELPPLPSGFLTPQKVYDYALQAIAADRARLAGQDAVALEDIHGALATPPTESQSLLDAAEKVESVVRPLVERDLRAAVDENFGRCGTTWTDAALARRDALDELRAALQEHGRKV